MANIYLKVPTYVAQFYRGRDPKHPLTEFDPVEFSPFDLETALMERSLLLSDGSDLPQMSCFSQRQWRNMLQGKPPRGGKRLLTRDENEWLQTREVCALVDEKANKKTDGYDYLCIQIPRQALVGRQQVPTNTSFSLPRAIANNMQTMLRNEFIRVFLDWIRQERFYCNQHGIQRLVVMMIDHFFYHYNICIGTNGKDRDSMRRMAMRWIQESKTLPNDRLPFDDEDAQYVYESEKDTQDVSLDKLLKELKEEVKKS